jgi:hypothetical protein
MFEMNKSVSELSRYMRTSWMLNSQSSLEFLDSSKIRFFSESEASQLAEQIRKRNVFARHSWENSFYYQRARNLANHTIIEVFRPGDPKSIGEEAESIASLLERIVVLSSTLSLPKRDLLRKLGIASNLKTETNLVYSNDFRFISSTSQTAPEAQGLLINETYRNRFYRCKFDSLAAFTLSKNEMAIRVKNSLQWLFDSRIESRLPASVIKTSIALETLLIFSESESLAQSLSERVAFILSSNPDRRKLISRIFKRFYETRSGIVHGSQKKAKILTPTLLETVDRLTILLYLSISANFKQWTTTKSLQEWCETQRWGAPSSEIVVPYPDIYLKNALLVGSKEF